MQTYGQRASLQFKWSDLISQKSFLPRVRYENVILSPSIWNITPKDIRGIPNNKDNRFLELALKFKEEKQIPDKVLFVAGDNKLLIDFNDPLSVQLLFSEAKGLGFQLEEYLFESESSLIKKDDSAFANQVIISFFKHI
jgi:hypothetical protein